MLVGHYGVAYALKRAEPRLSLGTLFLAVQLVDLAWGIFLQLGWEHVNIIPGYTAATPFAFVDYPLTHSLVAAIVWAALFGGLYYSWPTRNLRHHGRAALVLAVAVASHWFLDLVVHVPDLPLAGNDSPKLGLGLWRSVPATVAVELLCLGVGAWIYARGSSKRHPVRWGRFATVLGVLVVVALGGTLFGPPPSSVRAAGIGAVVFVIVMALLAAWSDRPAPPQHQAPTTAGHRGRHRERTA